jgi:UDP-glucose 4-epimerase
MNSSPEPPPRALVTGAAGFIGSHLARYLRERLGWEVVALDDLSGGFRENVPEGIPFVEGSIGDAALINRTFAEHRFDYVYHLAAYAAEGLSHFIKTYNYNNNLVGTCNLINASVNHDVKRFVFTSSIAVYGAGQTPMREDMTPIPDDPYGIAKLAAEMELRVSHEMFGLEYVIFRPHNVYGPGQNLGDMYRNVIGIFMNRLMAGEDLVIFGDGEQRRAFTYVDDIIPGMAESAVLPAARNQIFNIGSDTAHTVNELAGVVAEVLGLPGRVRHVEARKEVKDAWSDHSRYAAVFGHGRETPLRDGVRRMAEWAVEAGIRETQPFADIEIERNLPPVWAAATKQA